MSVLAYGEALVTLHRPAEQPGVCRQSVAGAELNVAIGLARLGHAVRWATAIADDALGDWIVTAARGEGVAVEAAHRPGRNPLLLKVALADTEPQVHYYRDGSAFALAPPSPDPAGAAGVVLSGVTPALSPACLAATRTLVEATTAAGIPLWFDVNMRRRLWSDTEAAPVLRWCCARADIVFADLAEAALVVGPGEPAELGARLLALGARQAVLKAGPAGAFAIDAAGLVQAPRLAGVIVRDPIGAGDAFDAGYLSAMLDGLPTAMALHRGHVCAAAVCRCLGDWEGFPRRRDLGDPDRPTR